MDYQASLSMAFSRQEYWSELPFPSAGDFPDPGIEPISPAWQADSLPLSHLGSPSGYYACQLILSLKIFVVYCIHDMIWRICFEGVHILNFLPLGLSFLHVLRFLILIYIQFSIWTCLLSINHLDIGCSKMTRLKPSHQATILLAISLHFLVCWAVKMATLSKNLISS